MSFFCFSHTVLLAWYCAARSKGHFGLIRPNNNNNNSNNNNMYLKKKLLIENLYNSNREMYEFIQE